MEEQFKVRFVKVADKVYIHYEDVCNWLREIGATEDTDVRNRLNLAADLLAKKSDGAKS